MSSICYNIFILLGDEIRREEEKVNLKFSTRSHTRMSSRKRSQGKKRKADASEREEGTTQTASTQQNEDEADSVETETSSDNSLKGTIKLSPQEVITCVGIEALLDEDNAPHSSSSCVGKSCSKEHDDIANTVVNVLQDL